MTGHDKFPPKSENMTITGLSNFGSPLERNICYINSSLQLLHSIPMIRNLLKKKAYSATPETLTPLCDEISRIFNYEGDVTSAGTLRQLLGAKEGLAYVMGGEQEDAALFLRKLLDQILNEVDPDVGLEELITISIKHQTFFNTPDGSCISCGYISPSQESSCTVLVLQESSGSSSLQDLIQYYLKDQRVQEFRCGNEGNCLDADSRNVQLATMRQIVTKLPAILFIQVPNKTVNPRANDGFFTVEGVRFEIVGVVDHIGVDTKTGHYITWAKHQSQWFKCDDKRVELDHGEAHFSANNYIFVGIRKDATDDDKERCLPCGKLFSSHLKHLQQAKICQKFYDLEVIKKENTEKSQILDTLRKRKTRANQTPTQKQKVLNDDKLRHQKSLANQTQAKKQKIQDDNKVRLGYDDFC